MLNERFVSRLAGTRTDDGGLRLIPFDRREQGDAVTCRMFAERHQAELSGGEIFAVILVVTGKWPARPAYAVDGEWRVDPNFAAQFEASRHELFRLRRAVLPSFAIDWLLRDVIDTTRYFVLGLYGEQHDLELCRDHPDIARFTAEHPPASYGAVPTTLLRFYEIAETGASARRAPFER
jgi:hypothetical protein